MRKGENVMNRNDRIEFEYKKAIKNNPCNAALFNDYAVFIDKYRHDFDLSVKYLNRAIKFEPENNLYKSNLNKLLKKYEIKTQKRYTVFTLFLVGVMLWIGYQGYTNFMNIFALFLLAQIVLNYQNKSLQQLNYSY